MIYNSPLYSPEHNLEVAIGAIEFKEDIIKNLREQIKNLRGLAELNYDKNLIDKIQYKHLHLPPIQTRHED